MNGFRKIVASDAWDFETEQVVQIPMLRGGAFGSNDLAHMAKRAGSDLVHKLAGLQFAPGEIPIHIIALGSTEAYGPNRNGDGFRASVCEQYHPTFVKHARFYRNHRADDPARSYGIVKASHWNARMQRVELVAALNSTEEAARRNGGLIADNEIKKLGSGLEVPTSMGCHVSHDVCSACGNKAKNRSYYCDAPACRGGGLKNKIAMLVSLDGDVHQLHADNPDPRFGDISHVPRQADRTSYVMGVLRKAASAGSALPVISGAELAEMLYEDPQENEWKKVARGMRALEQDLPSRTAMLGGVSRAGRLADFGMPAFGPYKIAQMTAALAEHNIVLPIEEFVHMLAGRAPQDPTQLKLATVGIFDRLMVPAENPYSHVGPIASQYRAWAAKLANDYSLAEQAIARRAGIARLRGTESELLPAIKTASHSPLVEEIAQQYGLYAVASLERIANRTNNFPLTAVATLLQNRAS